MTQPVSFLFCHSLDSSHSEESATSGVDSIKESSDECDSECRTRSMFPHQNGLWPKRSPTHTNMHPRHC